MHEEWSSETQGWMVYINSQPEEIKSLPLSQMRAALRDYHMKVIDGLKARLPDGIGMPVCWPTIGGACIVGPEEACRQLKAELEAEGKFSMGMNRRIGLLPDSTP
jgi:hypothetical protein